MRLKIAKLGLATSVLLCLIATASSHAQALHASLNFERCQIKYNAAEMDAQCATLARPENPDNPDGKLINLFVVKLPSSSPKPAADAFTIIQGGPGGSSVDMAIQFNQILDIIRAKRDVLIVDQRGTGRSNLLQCDIPEKQLLDFTFDRELTIELTQECLTKLNHSDLRFYTTSVAVQDLEAVRKAAGYAQLTVYGVSYGTRVAQHYLRRYPDNVRALIIDGVADIGLNLAGSEIARRSQDAFDGIVKRCNQTPNCQSQFGDIAIKFKELRQRLKQTPIEIEIAHPLNGQKINHTVSELDLLIAVRMMPYSTETIALLPMLITQAHAGDYTLLASQGISLSEMLASEFATGMHNSVMCTEDAPYVPANAAQETTNTYFGRDMMDSIATACEIWPTGLIDDDFLKPFESDKPVLILSGETDPITPPINGQRAANMFANSKHLIVPSHGHGVITRGCVPYLVRDFTIDTNLDELNTECIERERATPIFIDTTGPMP